MALKSLLPTSSYSPLFSTPSTLQTPSKSKSHCKFHAFLPQLCDINEDSEIERLSPKQSIAQQIQIKMTDHKISDLNINANEFVPKPIVAVTNPNTTAQTQSDKVYQKLEQFTPAHKPRAKLNIYIGKQETYTALAQLKEPFANTSTLYHYLDISTAFQMTDNQMFLFQTRQEPMISFINADLHERKSNAVLYGVVVPNDKKKIQKCNKNTAAVQTITNTKWLWKLSEFLTAKDIYNKYGIEVKDLPKSSRKIHGIQRFMKQESISSDVLYAIDWTQNNIRQISKQIRNKSKAKHCAVSMGTKEWIQTCLKSWDYFAAIPTVVYENGSKGFNYWTEWVKIVYVSEYNSFVGISFKNVNGVWRVTNVNLDKCDILNKYNIFGCPSEKYNLFFDGLDVSITSIEWLQW